ncbi:MAG: NPCBM/NEW2 domain-containing protein [Pirellulaceae bacterium]
MLAMLRITSGFLACLLLLAAGPARGEEPARKVAFVAGNPSHGYGSHEHYAGCMILAEGIEKGMPGWSTVVYRNGWPTEPNAFDGCDTIVMYSDGGGGHPVIPHMDQIQALADQGVGIVCLHYAVEVPKGEPGDHFLNWIGGYFETHWSVNPHWVAHFEAFPDHPISRGVQPFSIDDEWYYHMRFRPEMEGVTPILSAVPPESTLSRPDGPHSGNPHVRQMVGQPQHVAWASERSNGGRGFGFTGGHVHWNWSDENFRRVVLNAIVWTARGEVPEQGVDEDALTLERLEQNQDFPQPDNFNRDAIREQFHLTSSGRRRGSSAKPIFSSDLVTKQTPGRSLPISVDISGAKKLYLVVNDGGNGFGCDWANWAEPRLIGANGELRLTELDWKSATSGWGNVRKNQNANGGAMLIDGKEVAYGFGTHANSVIEFDLPEGYSTFHARGGLDDGGANQGNCGDQASVRFQVYTQAPPAAVGGQHDPEFAIDGLDIHEGLEATLFSSEPDLKSVTNLDIDHLGRIWVCEVMNYRGNNGKRPEGDRILILTDTDGDGICDETKVFYQGRDVDSAMGICVLGNKVIVSASPNVLVFTDEDGDDVPDSKEVLFSNTGQAQHDHSAHSFLFGPDGKLYWNYGNTGKQVCDAAGNVITDRAGNPVKDGGHPYYGGMVFRCDLDGSNFEVLGHNFRNNYEVTVDSFGTLWQSDNDDDGNRGVRINYVMEFGNYGYLDEITGAGWQTPRTNIETEIPLRHWHLNDPGVVPNLLQTGAGSPTGITVYEGDLLPEVFRGQVIHCDAGPNVVRAYPVTRSGAGYDAEMVNVLHGARDNWFRPADVCVAPDGSIFVTDWYDPGVGGHGQGDLERGRIFRVAPPGTRYATPAIDLSSVAGCIAALRSPNSSTRYLAFQALQEFGQEAAAELRAAARDDNPRIAARAIWLWALVTDEADDAINFCLQSESADLRGMAVRLVRRLDGDVIKVVQAVAGDRDPAVRREAAIALRFSNADEMPALWAELAAQHDGKDRWYLEALGIGAALRWDDCLAAYLKRVEDWNTEAGRDVVWRSRAKATPALLAEILKQDGMSEEEQARYFRAFDFLSGPEKDQALESLLLGL